MVFKMTAAVHHTLLNSLSVSLSLVFLVFSWDSKGLSPQFRSNSFPAKSIREAAFFGSAEFADAAGRIDQ